MPDPALDALIQQLPEVYQPIYGFPELAAARADSGSRIGQLTALISALSGYLGRPLRILDLGSAQGYAAFLMAEQGHHVTGVESLSANVAVAQALRERHPQLDVTFVEADVVDVFRLLDTASFDAALGLSVLHHLIYRDGHEATVKLLSTLAGTIPHGLFEMALASEPVFWAGALPRDPRQTLEGYAFIREVGQAATHLSDVDRPLFFCSQTTAFLAEGFQPILSRTVESHSGGNPSARAVQRYFHVPIGIAKVVADFAGPQNKSFLAARKEELCREAQNLKLLHGSPFQLPELIEFSERPNEIVLVRGAYSGEVLSRVAAELPIDDRMEIASQVLAQLAYLEGRGLYHQDLRLWNVIWDSGKKSARLIDYGSIGPEATDVMWPHDTYFSLLAFLAALLGGVPDTSGLEYPRTSQLDRAATSQRVVQLIDALLAHPRNETVIRDIERIWQQLAGADIPPISAPPPLARDWLSTVEVQAREESLARRKEIDALLADNENVHRQLAQSQQALGELSDHSAQQLSELQQQRDALAHEIELIKKTRGWKLLAPLRTLRSYTQRR